MGVLIRDIFRTGLSVTVDFVGIINLPETGLNVIFSAYFLMSPPIILNVLILYCTPGAVSQGISHIKGTFSFGCSCAQLSTASFALGNGSLQ